MNLLYEKFPDSVKLSGKDYPIYTDFKNWLKFFDMLEEPKFSEHEKMLLALRWYQDRIEPEIWEEGIQALIRFAIRGDIPEQSRNKGSSKKILSWSFDAPYIYAAFLSEYHIDLLNATMHWHLFLALFDALPEDTPIKQRMYYRGINIGEIKDKNEKKRILKIQRQIRIPQEKLNAFEIGSAFG
ncbi:MAG TPA: hypothetical protein DCO72_07795 [Ruminococcus sp.]|nr:hypothetical protein [Ruminococcus sp.]